MGEVWPKPTEKEKRELLEAYGDNLVFHFVRATIKTLNQPNIDEKLSRYSEERLQREFYKLARLMIINLGPKRTADVLFTAIEDISSDQWSLEIELPKQEAVSSMKFKSNSKIPILKIIEKYGFKPRKNKMVCPFHADGNPSLSIYPETNSFFCFGCRVGGDSLTFVQKMEELK